MLLLCHEPQIHSYWPLKIFQSWHFTSWVHQSGQQIILFIYSQVPVYIQFWFLRCLVSTMSDLKWPMNSSVSHSAAFEAVSHVASRDSRCTTRQTFDLTLFHLLPLLQLNVSTGTKKLVAATAVGAVSLLFLARLFQRRRRRSRKKVHSRQWEQTGFELVPPASAENGKTRWHPDVWAQAVP